MERWQLKQMQSLPLEAKIQKSKQRIIEWYEKYNGEVYVSFSGGKDSTVLLDLVRSIYPEVSAVYIDTGLEYPEIREIVKCTENVTWLRPKMNFKEVLDKYGFPVISKEVALKVKEARSKPNGYASQSFDRNSAKNIKQKQKYSFAKYKCLLEAPFLISNKCCDVMKKQPVYKYEKQSGRRVILGTMAVESVARNSQYLKYGCNFFEGKRPVSAPLSFWTDQDILQYIGEYNLPLASVYGQIIEKEGKLELTGVTRTGCMFCMFGCHLEEVTRFQRMKETHPKLYEYCIYKLGLKVPLDWIGKIVGRKLY